MGHEMFRVINKNTKSIGNLIRVRSYVSIVKKPVNWFAVQNNWLVLCEWNIGLIWVKFKINKYASVAAFKTVFWCFFVNLDKHLLVGKLYPDSIMTKILRGTNAGSDFFAKMSICPIQCLQMFQEEAAFHRKCNLFLFELIPNKLIS